MANPFNTKGNNMPNQPQYNMGQIKQVYNMLKTSSNPNQMINQMINSNPQIAQTYNLMKSNGNYEQMFREMCEQRGINADDFIKQLNQ